MGADLRTYALVSATLGKYCGATALTFNMHACSTLWSGLLADDLDMTPRRSRSTSATARVHFSRVVKDGAIYAQPFSEGSAAAAGKAPFGTLARQGGRRLAHQRQEDLRLALRRRALLRRAVHRGQAGQLHAATRCTSRCPRMQPGFTITGDWDPLGMRGTGVAHARVQGRVRAGRRADDAARPVLPGGRPLAAHVHHAVAHLHGHRRRGLRVHGQVPARRARRACRR